MSKQTKKALSTSPIQWETERRREKHIMGNPWRTAHHYSITNSVHLIIHYHPKATNFGFNYSWQLYTSNRYPLKTKTGNHFLGGAKTLKEAKRRAELSYIYFFARMLINKVPDHPEILNGL